MSVETLVQALFCLLFFGLPTAYLLRLIWLGQVSRFWPSVEGTIIRSHVRSWPGSRGGAKTSTRHYAPEIRYEHTVDGVQHTGHIVAFGRNWNTCRRCAQETAANYGVGKSVPVAHHPNKPELATLETQAIRRVYLFAMIMVGMMGSVVYGVLAGT